MANDGLRLNALRAHKNIPEVIDSGIIKAKSKGRKYELKGPHIDFRRLGEHISKIVNLASNGSQDAKDLGLQVGRNYLILPPNVVDAYCRGCEELTRKDTDEVTY
jgi:hypothetical protein